MISKSRTFAVVMVSSNQLGVWYLWKEIDQETGKSTVKDRVHRTNWGPEEKHAVIHLLKDAGLTVRFYDPEEKQWMDDSHLYGYVPAPGSRDGQWAYPTPEEFERDYLQRI